MILVAVLVMIALGAMIAAGAAFRIRAESSVSHAITTGRQARQAAMSGVDRAVALIRNSGGDPLVWADNPDELAARFVSSDGRDEWYFTVYAHNPSDPEFPRNGAVDEAGKINLNVASEQTLRAMFAEWPEADELVDSLLDYRDADDDPRTNGAEQTYYDALPHPFLVRNKPYIRTIEETLVIKGFHGAVVYGEDHNLNGLLDASEDDRDTSFPYGDNGDGVLDRGLFGTATTHSYEYDVDSAGNPRVNLNGDPAAIARLGLPEQTVRFIEEYRKAGNEFTHPSQLLNMTFRAKVKEEQRYTDAGGRERTRTVEVWKTLESGVGPDELETVMDRLTTRPTRGRKQRVVGLVNVATASVEVLSMIENIDVGLASRIADARLAVAPEDAATTAWLVSGGVVSAETYKEIAPALTSRSFQYRIRVVGFGVPSGRYCVLEAVVDLADGEPRIVYLRDLTRLGLPFAVDTELLDGGEGS
jgi:DNA uptake protein ComE-like DNA-binding protein